MPNSCYDKRRVMNTMRATFGRAPVDASELRTEAEAATHGAVEEQCKARLNNPCDGEHAREEADVAASRLLQS